MIYNDNDDIYIYGMYSETWFAQNAFLKALRQLLQKDCWSKDLTHYF